MTRELPPASPASAFLPQPDLIGVELPSSRGPAGEVLIVHVRRLSLMQVLKAQGDLPVPTGQKPADGATAAANLGRMEESAREVARLAVAAPAFDFDGSGAGPAWDGLPFVDRMAVYEAAMALAGLSALPETVRSFRGGPQLDGGASGTARGDGGAADSDGPGAPVEATGP